MFQLVFFVLICINFKKGKKITLFYLPSSVFNCLFIYLLGVLRPFQHNIGFGSPGMNYFLKLYLWLFIYFYLFIRGFNATFNPVVVVDQFTPGNQFTPTPKFIQNNYS